MKKQVTTLCHISIQKITKKLTFLLLVHLNKLTCHLTEIKLLPIIHHLIRTDVWYFYPLKCVFCTFQIAETVDVWENFELVNLLTHIQHKI